MLRVHSVSGAELLAMPVEEALTVRALKERLQNLCGLPRFRQRLLHHTEILSDDALLKAPMDLRLVLLSFVTGEDPSRLVVAAFQGRVSDVEEILQKPENPNGEGRLTPLGLAAARGHLKTMRLLLEARASIDKRDDVVGGLTALHHACYRGHVDAVRLLLAEGANKEAEGDTGYTPLCMACRRRRLRVVRLLLEAGARPARTRDSTPHFAGRSRLQIRRLLSTYKWSRRPPRRPL